MPRKTQTPGLFRARSTVFTLAIVTGISVTILNHVEAGESSNGDQKPKLRIGTYDNRAIAVAYAPSKFNPIRTKMQEYEKAKSDGDAQRVEELEAWGEKHQRKLHRQGFCRVPVDDLLAHVADKLPDVAKKLNVDAITWKCDFHGADIEIVDVTKELVMLFEPSEKTIRMADDIRKAPPVDLDEVDARQEH